MNKDAFQARRIHEAETLIAFQIWQMKTYSDYSFYIPRIIGFGNIFTYLFYVRTLTRPSRNLTSALSSKAHAISVTTEVMGITPTGRKSRPMKWFKKLLLPALNRPSIARLTPSHSSAERQIRIDSSRGVIE
jgi:hypothetical protein